MTLSRRLAAVEASLSPTQLVVAWITEAHSFGNVESYVALLLAQDPPVAPLDRLARQAARGARNATHGKRPEVVLAAVRSALRETVFRFELVVRINVSAHELLEREALIDAALAAQITLLTCEASRDARVGDRLGKLRDLLAVRVGETHAEQEARSIVEGRYLDVHGALFPDAAAAWDEQVRSTETIADIAARLAELEGAPPAVLVEPEAHSKRTAALVADLVEPAKADALEKLDEGRRAFGIATGWVRGKMQSRAVALKP
jgi:hypothetical protein